MFPGFSSAAAPVLVTWAAAVLFSACGPPPAPPDLRAGVYTVEQAARGRVVYATYCGNCHKPTLEGNDLIAALAGPVFLERWRGKPVSELLMRIRTTMPPAGRLDLADDEWVALITFLLEANAFPAGSAPLRPGDALSTLTF